MTLDEHSPIPYRITARGLRELEQWRAEEEAAKCDHLYRLKGGALECDHCGIRRQLPNFQSIPSYLRQKRGER